MQPTFEANWGTDVQGCKETAGVGDVESSGNGTPS